MTPDEWPIGVTRVFHYVHPDDVDEWKTKGWHVVATDLGHHGIYSVLVEKDAE